MTTLAVAIDAVYERWLAEFSAFDADALTGFDNELFEPPTDGTAFARLSVSALPDVTATLGGIGARRVMRRGLVILQIAAALDAGIAAAAALVEAARTVFERVSADDLHYEEATVRPGRSDGRWWLTRIEIPFHYTATI